MSDADPKTGPIQFYFDYISNNAYIAWSQIRPLAERYHRTLEPIPVLFAGLLKAHQLKGPAEIPAKRAWLIENVQRKANLLNIPLAPPAVHPFNPLLSLRTTLAATSQERETIIDALFKACWAESKPIAEVGVVQALLKDLNLDSEALLTEANSPAIKENLRTLTAAAVEKSVFGVPTMIVDNKLFWGYDDFTFLERYLAGEDLL